MKVAPAVVAAWVLRARVPDAPLFGSNANDSLTLLMSVGAILNGLILQVSTSHPAPPSGKLIVEDRGAANTSSEYEKPAGGRDFEIFLVARAEMFKAVVALLVAAAAAFAPVPSVTTPKTVVKAFENDVGVTAPLGVFDPFGVIADGDQERFELLRYIEIKHGRIAMLAFLGQVITKSGVHFPGYLDRAQTVKFEDIPTGFGALEKIPMGGYIQFFLFIFILVRWL